jgi:hypothetical protein
MGRRKPFPTSRLEIYHPVDVTRNITSLMTTQTSDVVIEVFRRGANAYSLDDFLQDSSQLIFFQYPRKLYIKITNPPLDAQNSIEVRTYREAYDLIKEMSALHPSLAIRPWPYMFEGFSAGVREFYFVVFWGDRADVLSEDAAWKALVGNTEGVVQAEILPAP